MFPSLSESYFAAVAEASPDVMRILELDGTVEFMNAHGQALLEIDRFEANHRRPWSDLWPQETRPQLLAALEAARRGEIARFRGRCPTTKGKPLWWDSVVSPIRDEKGRIVRLLASSRDVTELKAREEELLVQSAALSRAKGEAEAASEAKSAFLANMSHEIRTPLNGVLAMADLLCRSDLEAIDLQMARMIRDSAQMLDRLLSDVLDLARTGSGASVIEQAPFHLGETARSEFELARGPGGEKGLVLTLAIEPAFDRLMVGDASRLKQILNNLLTNAVKFTQAGSVEFRVTDAGDGRVRFAVRDTGVGFDSAEKTRLFRPFEQVDATITRRFGGSGLGLAIADQLATLMGGTLDCNAREGEGACFWLDLPLESAPNDDPVSDGESTPGLSDPSALRVLVADDNAANRKIVELILASVGAESVSVEDGAEAVAVFEIMAFDLVLMDIQMPVMDGLSAVRLLRLHEKARGGRPTPILMLSANAMPEHVAASVAAGANGHLSKPLTAGRLLSRVQDLVGLSQDPGGAEGGDPCDRRTAGRW